MVMKHITAMIRDIREEDKIPFLKALLDDLTKGQADTIVIHDENDQTILYCIRAAGPPITTLEVDPLAAEYDLVGLHR